MRSESTRALGQPSDTKPTLGTAREARDRALPSGLAFAAFVLAAVMRPRRLAVIRLAGAGPGEIGEGEVAEEVARLLLELLLHVHEGVGALLEVASHEALDRRPLHLDELAPGVGVEHGVLAVDLPRLVLQALLDLDEGMDVLLEVAAHHPLHGVAVEADDLR